MFFVLKNKKIKNLVVFSKGFIIPKIFIFKKLHIHKGFTKRVLVITKKIVGLKINSFIFNKKPFHFPTKMEKKKNYVRR